MRAALWVGVILGLALAWIVGTGLVLGEQAMRDEGERGIWRRPRFALTCVRIAFRHVLSLGFVSHVWEWAVWLGGRVRCWGGLLLLGLGDVLLCGSTPRETWRKVREGMRIAGGVAREEVSGLCRFGRHEWRVVGPERCRYRWCTRCRAYEDWSAAAGRWGPTTESSEPG